MIEERDWLDCWSSVSISDFSIVGIHTWLAFRPFQSSARKQLPRGSTAVRIYRGGMPPEVIELRHGHPEPGTPFLDLAENMFAMPYRALAHVAVGAADGRQV